MCTVVLMVGVTNVQIWRGLGGAGKGVVNNALAPPAVLLVSKATVTAVAVATSAAAPSNIAILLPQLLLHQPVPPVGLLLPLEEGLFPRRRAVRSSTDRRGVPPAAAGGVPLVQRHRGEVGLDCATVCRPRDLIANGE